MKIRVMSSFRPHCYTDYLGELARKVDFVKIAGEDARVSDPMIEADVSVFFSISLFSFFDAVTRLPAFFYFCWRSTLFRET